MTYDSLLDVFIEDIKSYLKENINKLLEEYELDKVTVSDAYAYKKQPTPPEISVLSIDYYENEDSNTYDEGEVLSNIALQFYCYGNEMKIKDSDKRYDPIQVTRILADYITKSMKKNVIGTKNKNIISVRKTTQSNAMQVRDMSLYYNVLRYEFVITNDYKKVYRK